MCAAVATLSASAIEDMTVPELKEELRSRNLKVSGVKQELKERLMDAMRGGSAAPSMAKPAGGAPPPPASTAAPKKAASAAAVATVAKRAPGPVAVVPRVVAAAPRAASPSPARAAVAAPPAGFAPSGDPFTMASLSDMDVRKLWDSISKPLLSIGTGGAGASHVRSLKDLLASHGMIKAKLAAGDTSTLEAMATELADQAGAKLLQVKGATMLFALSTLSKQQLMDLTLPKARRPASAPAPAARRGAAPPPPGARPRSAAPPPSARPAAAIGKVIDQVASKGSGAMDRQTLKTEWNQIANYINKEEVAADASERRVSKSNGRTNWRALAEGSADAAPTSSGSSYSAAAPAKASSYSAAAAPSWSSSSSSSSSSGYSSSASVGGKRNWRRLAEEP